MNRTARTAGGFSPRHQLPRCVCRPDDGRFSNQFSTVTLHRSEDDAKGMGQSPPVPLGPRAVSHEVSACLAESQGGPTMNCGEEIPQAPVVAMPLLLGAYCY